MVNYHVFVENCWGFLYGTAPAICKPGIFEQEFYSGHSGQHVVTFQSILTPDAVIVNLYGPVEGRRHDVHMLTESRLRERIRSKHIEWGNLDLCLYADKEYNISKEIQVPFKGAELTPEQTCFDKNMFTCRTEVEYKFLKVCQYFAFGNYWQNQKIVWQQTSKTYFVLSLLADCHTCIRGNELVRAKFWLDPLTWSSIWALLLLIR